MYDHCMFSLPLSVLTIGFGQAGYSLVEDAWTGQGSILEICLAISGGSVDRTVVVSVADEDGTAIGIVIIARLL